MLVAQAYDRLLTSMSCPQRYGTQFSKVGDSPFQLNKTLDDVPDEERLIFDVLPLKEQAKLIESLNSQVSR